MNDNKPSMFIGPKNVKVFGPENPFYVPEPTKWNREAFYNEPTNLVEYNSVDRNLDLNNLIEVEGKSGVWAIWGSKSEKDPLVCLDVHETLDIGYEIRMHEKDLDFARKTDWNDPIYTDHNRFDLFKRSKAITQWKNLTYILIAINVHGKINREAIEAQYAWDNKSIYWNRNYFQAVTSEMLENQRNNDHIMKLR